VKSTTLIVTALIALTLLVSACAPAATPTTPPATAMPVATQAPAATAMSSSSSATSMPAATSTSAPAMAAAAATVNIGKNSKYSAFLVDGKGMTLYLYTKDTPGTSTCFGSCAQYWPPLLTTGKPVAGSGVDMSRFGTTTRTDGTTQVTYNGWPLYYYAKDKQPGDTTGDGVGNVWYLITPSGDKAVAGG
jgi:predicted lipoprotein with Yx(FWY)xxD motif